MANFRITSSRINDDGEKELRVKFRGKFYWIKATVFIAGLLARGIDISALSELGVA